MQICNNIIEMRIFVGRNKFETNERRIWKVADGYLQVHGYCHIAYYGIWRHGHMVVSKPRYHHFSINIVHRSLAVAR